MSGQPVDAELFRRTAPAWNCVDYPGDGMHYTGLGGRCQWCGMTRDQIAAEHRARVAAAVTGPVHKAVQGGRAGHCGICGQLIKRIPGGQGPAWVHSDSGAVAAPNPPDRA